MFNKGVNQKGGLSILGNRHFDFREAELRVEILVG
jgi:hypothetical protein